MEPPSRTFHDRRQQQDVKNGLTRTFVSADFSARHDDTSKLFQGGLGRRVRTTVWRFAPPRNRPRAPVRLRTSVLWPCASDAWPCRRKTRSGRGQVREEPQVARLGKDKPPPRSLLSPRAGTDCSSDEDIEQRKIARSCRVHQPPRKPLERQRQHGRHHHRLPPWERSTVRWPSAPVETRFQLRDSHGSRRPRPLREVGGHSNRKG
jgi:hypothetical protein